MTHEEKVQYLFKIAVETATKLKIASPKSSTSLETAIDNVYAKLEALLDKKLNTESGQ